VRRLLELRLERIKCLSNLQFQLLEYVYDRRSIAERYVDGGVTLHIHGFATGDYRFCATWRRVDDGRAGNNCKVHVFVGIGESLDEFRPLASLARLQPLDCCNMLVADTFEKGVSPTPELLYAMLDGKLRFVFDLASIEASQLIDKIIQGGSQIVDGFSNENTNDGGIGFTGTVAFPRTPATTLPFHNLNICGLRSPTTLSIMALRSALTLRFRYVRCLPAR